jgi:hypothetical protein
MVNAAAEDSGQYGPWGTKSGRKNLFLQFFKRYHFTTKKLFQGLRFGDKLLFLIHPCPSSFVAIRRRRLANDDAPSVATAILNLDKGASLFANFWPRTRQDRP